MTYFFYSPDANNFAGVALSKQDDRRILKIFYSDVPLAPTWKPIQLSGIKENAIAEGDFPSLSNYRIFPLLTQRAWNALSPLLGDQCEPLPALHPSGAPLILVHILGATNCVNLDRSEVERYSDGGIMGVKKYSFHREKMRGKHIFKLPLDYGRKLIVDEIFRLTVENNHLEGLLFPEVPLAL